MQYVPAEKERLDHEVAARRAWDKGSKLAILAPLSQPRRKEL
jgi:hypothetical protein